MGGLLLHLFLTCWAVGGSSPTKSYGFCWVVFGTNVFLIDSEVILVSTFTLEMGVVFDAGALWYYRILKDGLDVVVKIVKFGFWDPADDGLRVYLGKMEGFLSVDVADAYYHLLIHEFYFDVTLRVFFEKTGEFVFGDG